MPVCIEATVTHNGGVVVLLLYINVTRNGGLVAGKKYVTLPRNYFFVGVVHFFGLFSAHQLLKIDDVTL